MNGLDLSSLPNFCSHEHWGLSAIRNINNDRIAGVLPHRTVGLPDFLGVPGAKIFNAEGDMAAALEAWKRIRRHHELDGEFQCTRRGILALHGCDLSEDDPAVWEQADTSLREAYEDIYGWTQRAMAKAHFTKLIRPIVTEYYVRQETPESAKAQAACTDTLLRIDPFLAFLPEPEGGYPFEFSAPNWWPPEGFQPMPQDWRDELITITGVEPVDADSWRALIAKVFDIAEAGGCLGIKDMRAKSRPLDYPHREDSEVAWSGVRSLAEVNVFQDWIVNECCRQCHERGWTFQIHTGTHNLTESSPLGLYPLAKRYTNMKVVLLHCWPFLAESGWLAKYQPNVYVDACWLPLLSPAFFRQAIELWLNYVPLNKIMCGHDAHSVEGAAGSALFTREILGEALAQQGSTLGIPEARLMQTACDILHNNAVAVYGIGDRVEA